MELQQSTINYTNKSQNYLREGIFYYKFINYFISLSYIKCKNNFINNGCYILHNKDSILVYKLQYYFVNIIFITV